MADIKTPAEAAAVPQATSKIRIQATGYSTQTVPVFGYDAKVPQKFLLTLTNIKNIDPVNKNVITGEVEQIQV